jgi:hypothetical protein
MVLRVEELELVHRPSVPVPRDVLLGLARVCSVPTAEARPLCSGLDFTAWHTPCPPRADQGEAFVTICLAP